MKAILSGCLSAVLACALPAASWHDPSSHKTQFVSVAENVRLEVLEWGRTGPSVVLLAGYNTAHLYDEFAEKLAETCHVYAITRRGFGASSRPASGYTAQDSAGDVLKVLDKLQIANPVLVGHSFGGQDLDILGARHPERVAGLVYLNAAEDATLGAAIWPAIGIDPTAVEEARKKLPAAMRERPQPDYSSFAAYRAWQTKTLGFAFPEAEFRQLFVAKAGGAMGEYLTPNSVRDAMFQGVAKPDYASIQVPVLALFAAPLPLDEQVKKYHPGNADQREAMERVYAADRAIGMKHKGDLRAGVPEARLVDLPGANHYVFLSNEADVLRELSAFLAGLK